MNPESKAVQFRNFSDEAFSWQFDKVTYTFPANQTIYLEDYKAFHFAKHLVDRELQKQGIRTDDINARKTMLNKCFTGDEVTMQEMFNANIEPDKEPAIEKPQPIIEEKKSENSEIIAESVPEVVENTTESEEVISSAPVEETVIEKPIEESTLATEATETTNTEEPIADTATKETETTPETTDNSNEVLDTADEETSDETATEDTEETSDETNSEESPAPIKKRGRKPKIVE